MTKLDEVDAKEVAKKVESAYATWFKSYMKIFLRRTVEWVLIYIFGYYNASFGWLLAPLFFLVLRDKRAKEKKAKFDIVRSIANSDEQEILHEIQKFSNLPSWVMFPDMERVEWLNKIICQLWPYAGHYCRDLCRDFIEPAIREALREYKIPGFKFEKIILGDTPPRLSGIKVYDDTSRHEVIMDADFVYAGDCKFEVALAKFKAGIKDLQVSGRVRVVMKPLVRQIPLVGGLQVFFLNNPEVDFNLIGIADFFDMPGLSDILRSIVIDQIANMMVLPNRYPIQLVQDISVIELKAPAPAGVIRLQVIEAKNLMKKDLAVLGMGKSDPYCVMRLGAQKFQTKTINNTVNPVWNFCCEFLADETSGQQIDFDLWDSDDVATKDEKLGRANLDIQNIYKNGMVDMWVPLSDAKSGRVHIKATWMDLAQTAEALPIQLQEIRTLQNTTKNPLHSAVLMVWVDSAKKLNNIPDPFVRLQVANSKQETIAHLRTNDPVFEEGFTFLIRNPKTQELLVEVVDQRTGQLQGKVEIDLNTLLENRDLESNAHYNLTSSTGGMASIKLSLTLRILKEADRTTGAIVEPEPLEQPRSSLIESAPPVTEKLVDIDGPVDKPAKVVVEETGPIPAPPPDDTVVKREAARTESGVRQRIINSGVSGLGRIKLTVTYGEKNGLAVVVHKVENLQLEEDDEIPDPYVKLYLLPDRSRDSKRKTDVIKDSCNPEYEESFTYKVEPKDLTQRTLQVSVINKKGFFRMQHSAVMGQVHIDCGILSAENPTQWYELAVPVEED